MDIFFVISGFLISTIIYSSLNRSTFSFVEFYGRRIKRIFPALLLVLAGCFVFGWFVLLAADYKQLGKHIAGGAGFISNLMLWNESGYFDNVAETKPLLHLWSLGIEEQFYIFWPLLLWGVWKYKLNWLSVTLAILVISFVLNVQSTNADAVAAFFSPQTRIWELLLGSLIAYFSFSQKNELSAITIKINNWLERHLRLKAKGENGNALCNILSLLGLLLIVVGLFCITRERHYPGTWALMPTLGAVLIISAGNHAWINRKILSNRVLVWFGLISYPLYLWHWPLLSFARIIENETPSRNTRIGIVLTSILLAWLTCKLIERPLRFGKYGTTKIIALVLLMIGVGCLGYGTYQQEGFGNRFPKMVQEFTDFKYNYEKVYRSHTCFLEADESYEKFGDCGVTRDKGKKTILIWGDSHSAHLYFGYQEIFGPSFNIIQRSASGCPPLMDNQIPIRKFCKEINDKTFALIKQEMPDKVVLAAYWLMYGKEEQWPGDWHDLSKTISKLKEIGINNIDLIGPEPVWKDSLPKQLFQYFKKDAFHSIPMRMKTGLDADFINLDLIMMQFAASEHINYVSPAKILCNELGCITRLGDTGDSLMAWDYGHLTSKGSEYLVSKFPKF